MQVVGNPCEICGERIKSEIDGAGCVTCQRRFHDACVLAGPPIPETTDTYRDAAGARPPTRAPRKKVRCPGCGADVRKAMRAARRAAASQREAHEEQRRLLDAGRSSRPVLMFRAFQVALLWGTLFVLMCVQMCGHR